MNKLTDIIKYAKNNSEYYRRAFNEHKIDTEKAEYSEDMLLSLPILTKSNLVHNYESIVADEYRYTKSDYTRTFFTSGSSGILTKVLWADDDYYKSNMMVWRKRKMWYGISPTSKRVNFHGTTYYGSRVTQTEPIVYSSDNLILTFSRLFLSEEHILNYYQEILKFQPEWIAIQPSIAVRMVDVLTKYSLPKIESLKYIELNGEILTKNVKAYVKDYFNTTVADMYGANEVNSIALECPFGNMHILSNNIAFTLKDASVNCGNMIVTSLYNLAFPIINYELGDIVQIKNSSCSCGCDETTIEKILGRNFDKIEIENDDYISPYHFLYIVEKVNTIFNGSILQFKIIQNKMNHLFLYLKINREFLNWKNTIKRELSESFSKDTKLREIPIDIVFTEESEEIFRLNSNKFKIFEKRFDT